MNDDSWNKEELAKGIDRLWTNTGARPKVQIPRPPTGLTFWAVTCLRGDSFGAWDRDPQAIDVQLALPCPYCGGKREKLLA
jgi:hypothetical protein